MGPRLFIRCLGEPLLLDARGEEIRLRVRKHLALVLFLALEPRHRATRERLRRFLWPEGNSAQSLSQAIVEIRRGLGDDVFVAEDHHLALRRTADICTDLDVLRTGDADLMLRELSQSFWSHVLFDGMEIEEAEEWNSWLCLERSRWREKLGRMGEEAAGSLKAEVSPLERARLRDWSRHLLGIAPAAPAAVRRHLMWHEADSRVVDVKEAITSAQSPVISLESDDIDEALAVLVSAHRSDNRCPSILDVAALDPLRLGSDVAEALLALPGAAGADPETIRGLTELVETTTGSLPERLILEDICGSIADSNGLLILLPANASAECVTLFLSLTSTPSIVAVLLGTRALYPALEPHQRVLSLRVERLSSVEFLNGSSLLRAHRPLTDDAFHYAVSASDHSLLLLETLLDASPSQWASGTKSESARATSDVLAAKLSNRTGLAPHRTISIARKAIANASLARTTAIIHVRQRPTLEVSQRTDHDLAMSLLLSCPERLCGELESAVIAGHAQGHSINALLLACRSSLGLANHEVAADIIQQRLAEGQSQQGTTEALEAMAFAFLLTSPKISDLVGSEYVQHLQHESSKRSSANAVFLLASMIISQRSRDLAGEHRARKSLSMLTFEDPLDHLRLRTIAARADTLEALRLGQFARAYSLTTQQYAVAEQNGWSGAEKSALSNRMISAYRMGNYSEVLALGERIGHTALRSKAAAYNPQAIMLVRALKANGETRRANILRDQMNDFDFELKTARGRILEAEYLEAVGAGRRAVRAAEAAFEERIDQPLPEQEGVWAKWAVRVLPDAKCMDVLAAIAASAAVVDPRDQLMTLTYAKARGLCTKELVSLGFNKHRLPSTALF